MKISDHLIQLFMEGEWPDRTILTKEAFSVNIRLYKSNPSYRGIILEIVKYMDEHLRTTFDDYPKPKGIAAPNLGFPFRIIGFTKTSGSNQFFLNPKVTTTSASTATVRSNCGSLRMPAEISLERYLTIAVEYYDLEGNKHELSHVGRNDNGFVIQNGVDQLNGINIIDRQELTKKKSTMNNYPSHGFSCNQNLGGCE